MDFILKPLRKFFHKRCIKRLAENIRNDLLDDFLELLLTAVRLTLCIDKKYRRNIENFNARYLFRSEDGKIAASAIFANSKMKMKREAIDNTNVTVIFRDGKALWEFLMSGNPDVFSFVLENKLRYEGNLNYLLKFGYMAKRLQLMAGM